MDYLAGNVQLVIAIFAIYENIVFANTFIIFYFTLFNQICIHKTDELWEIIVCLF